ncbi:MAG: glycosyltransferase family 39 protein [Thermodesulfobacteriota bacterium]
MSVARAAADAPRTPHAGWLDTSLLLLAGAVLFAAGIADYPLWDPGEGRNAQAAREMARAGRWLVPLLYGEPYYDKPAPFYWLLLGFQRLLGESELALRAPSVLASLGTLGALHRFALPRFGRRAAALAALIYVTSPEVVALARFCNFDATLTFCLTTATVAWLCWLERRDRFPWLAYLAMGLGVLVKGPVAVVLPLLTVIACAWRRGCLRAALRVARPLAGALVVGALVLPWLVAAGIADPAYVHTFLVGHNVERFLGSGFGHERGLLFYAPVVMGGMFPWSLLLPVALLAPVRGAARDDVVCWAAVVLVFFSIAEAKLATYVLPAFPPLAAWLGASLAALVDARVTRALRWLRAAFAAWAAALLLLPIAVGGFLWVTYPELWWGTAWTLPLPLFAWLGLRRMRGEAAHPLAVCLLFAAVNAYIVTAFYLRAAPLVSRVASDAEIARLAQQLAPDATIVGFRIQPASLSYYAHAPVRRADRPEEIGASAREGPLLIVTRRRHEPLLRAAGIPLYVWLDTRRHLLYATMPVS